MKFARVLFCFIIAISQIISVVKSPVSDAVAQPGLVISHIVTGESSSSSSEMVAVYNNGTSDVDMTGYCLKNKSTTFACIAADANTRVYIKSHNFLTISSTVFAANHSYAPDTTYVSANTLQVGGDSVTLVDRLGNEVDKVSWGSVGGGINSLTNGILQRKADQQIIGQLIDTDTMSNDFVSSTTLSYPANASYDVVTLIDVCPNIAGTQQSVPSGYLSDENGNCQPDSCLNIVGLQTIVPESYDSDTNGNCIQHDECDNITGIQTVIPLNMVRGETNTCTWNIPKLQITEILPNAAGSDTGNEFIEVYNPTLKTVDLSLYSIKTGVNSDKVYSFPVGATILPGEYRAFTDSTMKFTLLNTTGRVVLSAIDGSTVGDTGIYNEPRDGESWALIDGAWQYTAMPTPGAVNVAFLNQDEVTTSETSPAACPSGKYRSPLTNRCRSVAADSAVLASCDSGQYRNPETGRCKKISVTAITPCKDGQYRSEETNRCRNIITANSKPCKDNQYRSETTNRCRNLSANEIPRAAFAVQSVKDTPMIFAGWWAVAGIGVLAVGYAAWEWRREIRQFTQKALSRFSIMK